ncbi:MULTISPECIES: MarR family winged helix-turn-helix transcriptional regulator [Geomicrobium]|uniref:DNA-binding MarR family transcriptional regulator n=1 Tax=Geomicrobium sediminis TaxID=1347788 RepID=A0ABS2P8W5_9BACL|nr:MULTISPECIES: MarR family transcriptional regulator [unclassified Geomicrobium]EZH66795.1 MarR family transcriptional regulator [Bacillaceae bacterium JMAK1]MBM7631757.1 DNA-binding MarR family transcriptional regulator [Geomicrobium sediminis]GAJ99316.1 transcriptional regulator, MarR family [Geomicrobium sp. JCM 19055]GAK09747.1 transcriptional regulator, MarR family [Geomicrobium sp. JCM 19038]
MRDNQVESIERSLRRISYTVKQKGREILNQFPITPPQFIALQYLKDKGDLTIGELSQKMYLAFSTTTDLVDRMEKNELVERVRDQRDRRVVRVHILEEGKVIIDEVIQKRQEYLQEVLVHFSSEEVDQLQATLGSLHEEMSKD